MPDRVARGWGCGAGRGGDLVGWVCGSFQEGLPVRSVWCVGDCCCGYGVKLLEFECGHCKEVPEGVPLAIRIVAGELFDDLVAAKGLQVLFQAVGVA